MKRIIPYGAGTGSYSKLSPPFSDAIDYYLSEPNELNRLKERSLMNNATPACTFFYAFQNKGVHSFKEINEEDVTGFFVKDGKPRYYAGYRYRLSHVLDIVSAKYPECKVISSWIPHIRVTRKSIQYLTEEEAAAVKDVCTSDNSGLSYQDKAVFIQDFAAVI